ncbi:MAG: hypothetical protein ACXWLB_03575 [Reyranella sp.]
MTDTNANVVSSIARDVPLSKLGPSEKNVRRTNSAGMTNPAD